MINVYENQAQESEWTVLFQKGGYSATLTENNRNIYFHLFSILNYETE